MNHYLGIDLGTSAVKLILLDKDGAIIRSASEGYDLHFPKPGWSEQNPADWWTAVQKAYKKITEDFDTSLIKGIGVAGQMHGLVILDKNDKVIRPAILWNDGRTDKETEYLNQTIGKDFLVKNTANIAFAGFTAPKLIWLKNNEPDSFERITKIMLPKDYINYLLTGVHATDFSDASGLLLLDVANKCWSDDMLGICGITEKQMPKLFESYEVIGTVSECIAAEFGLSKDVKVVAGAGDNAAAAIGTGCVKDGMCNISLGTSDTVFISADSYIPVTNNAIHSFCHSNGKYHLMGCILSAASCNKWFYKTVLKETDYDKVVSDITDEMLGNNNVYFLPYLMGERSPINDTNARGTFIGMDMGTSQADMALAILEGVAFAIKDNFKVAEESGIDIQLSSLCGGGAKMKIWQRILADVLNITLRIPESEEGPGFGAAILAMVGANEYGSVEECSERFVHFKEVIHHEADKVLLYKDKYENFKKIYPTLKSLFKEIK